MIIEIIIKILLIKIMKNSVCDYALVLKCITIIVFFTRQHKLNTVYIK